MMRLGFALAMSLGCLLSCGPMPPGEGGAAGGAQLIERSGSRLKRFYWAGDDGVRVATPGTFWDSLRQQRCGFQEYQGRYLCLPVPMPKNIDPADYVGGDFLHE